MLLFLTTRSFSKKRNSQKTWRIRNDGNCPWPAGTSWVFVSGSQMGGPSAVPVLGTNPGETADVSVNLIAPDTPGTYTGYWTLRLPEGRNLDQQYYVRIVVPEPSPTPTPKPVVILMDSAHQLIVYNPETYDAGRTNTDDIADILADLPVDIRMETTSMQWQREEQVRLQDPALIIIHASAFYEPNVDYRNRFNNFIKEMAYTSAKILIYGRSETILNDEDSIKNYYESLSIDPSLQGRIYLLYVPRYIFQPPNIVGWEAISQELKGKVKTILELN